MGYPAFSEMGIARAMRSISGYVLRISFVAFVVVLVSLTGVIWITQALRGIDLMTSRGQTILVFLGYTGLAIPLLVLVIAPVALVVALAHVLNRLAGDSEIIVMNAAGLRPFALFQPILLLSVVVSLLVAFLAFYAAPLGLRQLKQLNVEITADVVANIVQPGRFKTIERGLTLYIRERRPNGQLRGIFLDDRRDPKEQVTIIAESGVILKNDSGTFLVLESGSLQRREANQRDPAVVIFDRNAFDLTKFANPVQDTSYTVRERYLWELAWPKPDDPIYKLSPGRFRSEFHDRIMAPLYPLIFGAMTFAFLGAPRTTRQSRSISVAMTIAAVGALRIVGFAGTALITRSAFAAPVLYAILLGSGALACYVIGKGVIVEPPAILIDTARAWFIRIARRLFPRWSTA